MLGWDPQSAYRCPPAQESRPRTTSSLSPGSHASASSVRVRLWNVENATVTTIQSHCLSGGRTRAECRHVGCLEEGQASHEELASSSEPAAFLRRETAASSRPGSSPAPLPHCLGKPLSGATVTRVLPHWVLGLHGLGTALTVGRRRISSLSLNPLKGGVCVPHSADRSAKHTTGTQRMF